MGTTKTTVNLSKHGIGWPEKLIVHFSETNVHIEQSCFVDFNDIPKCIELIRARAEELGYNYKRSNKSWRREWYGHNFLFNCGYKIDRTGHVDLNEDEKLFRRIMYMPLSILYSLFEL